MYRYRLCNMKDFIEEHGADLKERVWTKSQPGFGPPIHHASFCQLGKTLGP